MCARAFSRVTLFIPCLPWLTEGPTKPPYGSGSKLSHQGTGTAGLNVFVAMYQGKPFWGCPIFDDHAHFRRPRVSFWAQYPLVHVAMEPTRGCFWRKVVFQDPPVRFHVCGREYVGSVRAQSQKLVYGFVALRMVHCRFGFQLHLEDFNQECSWDSLVLGKPCHS